MGNVETGRAGARTEGNPGRTTERDDERQSAFPGRCQKANQFGVMFSCQLNVFQTSVDEVGLVSECTSSQTANSEGSAGHHKDARLQQPAHGN